MNFILNLLTKNVTATVVGFFVIGITLSYLTHS